MEQVTISELASIFSVSTLETAGNAILDFIPRIIVAGLFLLAFWIIYRVSLKPIEKVMELRKFDPALSSLLVRNLYKYSLYIFGIILALSQLGIDVTAAIAGIGVIGLALGFAAKDSVANVISGITIFWDKPFLVGDIIEIGGKTGTVREITLRSTRIQTRGNQFLIVPNQDIVNSMVINHSKHGPVRVEVSVGIAYKEDVQKAREALITMFARDNRITYKAKDDRVSDPEVVVKELGDSSVNLEIRFWVHNVEDQFRALVDYTEKTKKTLEGANIEIPFPHMQLEISDKIAQKLH